MHATGNPVTWSSRMVFLMAAVGAAVGLGNMWKFPYTAGVSGGGAFVLVYLVCIAAVAVPVVMAELLIGRRGRADPISSTRMLGEKAGAGSKWQYLGWLNVSAAYLILTFYSVIAGWALAYIPRLATGVFAGATGNSAEAAFDGMLADPGLMIIWHTLFMMLTIFIVARGVKGGIETAVKFLMPSLFIMLFVLVGYALVAGDAAGALAFLFSFDFSKVNAEVVLNAVGQAFFSVSVAMGLMIAYGSYLPKDVSIGKAACIVAACDTVVAMLAGLAIFPLVFQHGLDPAEGAGLMFVTLPIAFGNMPAGALFGTLFFVLVVFAALTSSIAILEPIVAWGSRRGASRGRVAVIAGVLAWIVGLGTVFSFNIWDDVHPLGSLGVEKTFFDLVDYLTSNVMLPLGGILIALFAGWTMSSIDTRDELGLADSMPYRLWRNLLRYLVPVALVAVFIANVT